MKAILFLSLAGAVVATGCASHQPTGDKPAMRAMGQAAEADAAGSDEAIGTEVRRRLEIANPAATAGVIVEVSGGVVTLRGAAATLQEAWRAEAAAAAVPGVKRVQNEMLVK